MNTSPDAMTALISLVSILGLWTLVVWFYRDYRIDAFRQQLFAIRDDLFDMARAGHISFDDPAYGILRSALNGFIRFSDRLNFSSVVLFRCLARDHELRAVESDSFAARWDAALATLRPEVKQELNAKLYRVHLLVFEQVILTSPTLMILILPAIAALAARHVSRAIRHYAYRRLRASFDALDSAALELGGPGIPARAEALQPAGYL